MNDWTAQHSTTTDLLHIALREINQALSLRAAINTEIHRLEDQGMAHATPYWKPNPNPGGPERLYLVYPTPPGGGHRRQEYVGTNPERQREAMARVERHKRAQELRSALNGIDNQLQRARRAALDCALALQQILTQYTRNAPGADSGAGAAAADRSDPRQLSIHRQGA